MFFCVCLCYYVRRKWNSSIRNYYSLYHFSSFDSNFIDYRVLDSSIQHENFILSNNSIQLDYIIYYQWIECVIFWYSYKFGSISNFNWISALHKNLENFNRKKKIISKGISRFENGEKICRINVFLKSKMDATNNIIVNIKSHSFKTYIL